MKAREDIRVLQAAETRGAEELQRQRKEHAETERALRAEMEETRRQEKETRRQEKEAADRRYEADKLKNASANMEQLQSKLAAMTEEHERALASSHANSGKLAEKHEAERQQLLQTMHELEDQVADSARELWRGALETEASTSTWQTGYGLICRFGRNGARSVMGDGWKSEEHCAMET